MQLSEFGRCHAFILFKRPVEVTFIDKIQFVHDLIDAQIAMQEAGLYQLHFIQGNVVLQRLAGLTLK
jgi:hypothetical protein